MSTAEVILIIGIVLTFLSSLYSIINTKKSKYIETITTQRIKNLEIIKNEVAMIVTNIQFALINSLRYIENEEIKQGKPIDEDENLQNDNIVAPIEEIFNGKSQVWSCSDLIIHLNLLKLRINFRDDNNIILVINYFLKLFTEYENINQSQIRTAYKKLNDLLEISQMLINSEWEKVKVETKGKFFNCF